MLKLFVGASALLLLVACANVATLLVNRSLSRRHELAVRLAIGASPASLVRTAFAESLVVAAAGSALGTVIASFGVGAFVSLSRTVLPRTTAIHIDLPVLAAVGVIALVVTVFCGTAPALTAARTDLVAAFHDSSVPSAARRIEA